MVSILSKRITSDSKILGGKPAVRGTRLSVEFILELMRSGMSFDEILNEYPQLTRVDLEAVVAFAKHAVSREEMVPLRLAANHS